MDEYYVYDALEHRQWGPFADVDAANAFVEDDKYLTSIAVVTGDMRKAPPPKTYHPNHYHMSTNSLTKYKHDHPEKFEG